MSAFLHRGGAWLQRPQAARVAFGASRRHRRSAHRVVVPRATLLDVGTSVADTEVAAQSAAAISKVADTLQAQGNSPTVAILGGVVAVGAFIGALALAQNNQASDMATENAAGNAVDAPADAPKPKNAVLVFGSSGKMGRIIVKELLASRRDVVAAIRGDEKAAAFEEIGAYDQPGKLFVRAGIDITDAASLLPQLLDGVTQIVSAVGPVFGKTPDGTMGYLDNMTSERVDAQGVANVAELAKQLQPTTQREAQLVLNMSSAEDLEAWKRLDDVIMGGQSSSGLEAAADGSGAVWSGDLIVEGGGFCGTGARTNPQDLDLGDFDGVRLRVRGDGQTFKLNLKTADQEDAPESTYQAQFDTVAGEWVTIDLPWHEFVPVKRAQVDRTKLAVDPSQVRQFGLVLSRFEYNGYPNPNCKAGAFKLEVAGGIMAYKAPHPALVMVSSAATERNAIIGDDQTARKQDVPIVQLNPGGVLNHKYRGENAVRGSSVPYTVIRSVGLTTQDSHVPFLLEARQGDSISGKISRTEIAQLVAAAVGSPAAVGKTFEARRSEAADARGKAMDGRQMTQLFLGLVEDRHRPRAGLLPFPKAVPPPPTVTEQRKQEILADDRVQTAMKAGRGGRVRSEEETAAASSVTPTSDGGSQASSAAEQPSAREWIDAWRRRSAGASANSSSNGAASNGAAPPSNGSHAGESAAGAQMDAKTWIENWRARQKQEA